MKKINICVRCHLHILTLLFLVACHQPENDKKTDKETAPQADVPFVSTMTMQPAQLDIFEDLPARVAAVRVAEIRPQVSGIVQHRLFKQGAEVKAGQPLFQIDPTPFQADVDTAKANLQKAKVTLKRALEKVAYLRPLVEADAISRQEYDDAVLQRDQASADVAQTKASLARRLLDLKYASVTAPIAGRIDQTLVTEGALVSRSDNTPMTRIEQIDQVFIDIRRPSSSLESLRETFAADTAEPIAATPTNISILRSNGQPYPLQGQLLFSGINIDTNTGDVLLRVLVDNKQRLLLPGMFVKARVLRSRYANALTVPQQAITHIGGMPHVWIIDSQDKAALKAVSLGALVQGQYHIKSGLHPGDHAVVEGKERLRDGMTVHQRPWQSSATL
ncbi:Toluene efflux pump periplasmic linker protein TtgA precursor [Vibrio ruber DSM 16370]|uniref:Toluene efflux pump periplasmic linker protein TtgA n=1 Tax=Vibrio ruber (strain DSM 16370 / JCM 11486 / BCRC 17186 / CECT 7878 / LMG 23124 / VR1) TaxID=1123498 RepID=A0A1R4LNQ0_VIBR1|nr:efflux RND transporter periplasmic adaptor subunit [Vibrio ruber]SJN58019.1 Toluene efflux pump periplasmic linker protein TtgA precursor [Vibrio ruber DSM 16370]